MERLTKYDEFGNAEFVGIDNTKLYERLVCDETVALTIATNKLSELEDVLEKHNIESVEELDLILQGLKNIHQENAHLKQELAELKQLQKQLAVEELEKIYNLFEPYENLQKDTILCANNDISFIDYLENRIKELGGEENE